MHLSRVLALLLLAGSVVACSDDDGPTGVQPTGGVRFVNLLPDTVALDFRVIKPTITHAPQWLEVQFRGFSPHQQVSVGTHDVRAFFSGAASRDEDDVQIIIAEADPTFEQNTNYSVMVIGFARSGQTPAKQVLITTDMPPAVAAGQFHVRAVHAAAGIGAVDVYIRAAGATTLPATPTFSNVAFGTVTNYAALPVATGALEMVAVPVGGGTPIVTAMPQGSAGTSSTFGTAGTAHAGGALTAAIAPASVAGSLAPQTPAATFGTPAVIFLSDRRTPLATN